MDIYMKDRRYANRGQPFEEFLRFANIRYAQKKVAVVPGTAFGKSGEGFVRASYCYSVEHLKEALKRIENFLKKL